MKLSVLLLLAVPATQGSRLHQNDNSELLPLQDTSLAQLNAKYTMGATGEPENETVASDFASFIKAWGIDFKSTWFASHDPTKSTLWNFLSKISDQVGAIHNAIGLHAEDHGGALVTLKDYIVTLRSEVKNDMTTATQAIISSTAQEILTLRGTTKASEDRLHDNMHEIVARLRFLTERIKTVESALGIGYIDDAGIEYKDYVTAEYPLAEPTPTAPAPTTGGDLPVIGTSGVSEALAQVGDRLMDKKVKMPRMAQVKNAE